MMRRLPCGRVTVMAERGAKVTVSGGQWLSMEQLAQGLARRKAFPDVMK